MKIVIVVFTIISLGLSAPQPKKLFHEHFEDFTNLIEDEVGSEFNRLMISYADNNEFQAALDYMSSTNFRDLVKEMEDLPEFQAVIEFLENDNIDIHYFLDMFNELLENGPERSRQAPSGTNFGSFIEDSIALLPKDKLNALYQQKIAEDEEFASAIENLSSPEWDLTLSALFENEVFRNEVVTLAEYGIHVDGLLRELVAIFGQ